MKPIKNQGRSKIQQNSNEQLTIFSVISLILFIGIMILIKIINF